MSAVVTGVRPRLLAGTGGGCTTLGEHLTVHGTIDVPRPGDDRRRAALRRAVQESGLGGRGGAAFPSAVKWEAVTRDGRRALVVVNAMEGEPASAKDRILLTRSPHLVLDGAELVAAAIGTSRVTVCVADDADGPAAAVERAIAERQRAGMAGVRYDVGRPPGRYVTGEESALVAWLEGRPGLPSLRIDKSVPLRVARRPALVHNAETLAQVALVARHGPAWFREAGLADAPGTTLVTVGGAVRAPGVVEVELGTPIGSIAERAVLVEEPAAYLVGGYGGAWLGAEHGATPYAPRPLREAGAAAGVGIVLALAAGSCGIAETARVVRFMAGESAGQCGPCVFGLHALADDLEALWTGRAALAVLDRIGRRAAQIDGRGACRHPDGVVRVVRTALSVFAADAHAHARGRPCPGHGSPTRLAFPPRTGPPADRSGR